MLLVAVFVIPQWLIRHAVRKVIRIFRKHNATDVKNAKTGDELGLGPLSIRERMFRLRDYKPYALTVLMRAEIVQQTEGGKLYLLEDKLSASNISKYVPRPR